jgi:hypothetical protein
MFSSKALHARHKKSMLKTIEIDDVSSLLLLNLMQKEVE